MGAAGASAYRGLFARLTGGGAPSGDGVTVNENRDREMKKNDDSRNT